MKFTFPSKTFVLGEYSILRNGPALMLGHGPFFEANFDLATTNPFHPESPAGKFCQAEALKANLQFVDPHKSKGGFGCSGAEFLSCWALKHNLEDKESFAWKAWDASREFPGSGADILTQAYGANFTEPFFLKIDLKARTLMPLKSHLGLTISLFRTGQKLPTHEHLKKLPEIPETLANITRAGIAALENKNRMAFADAIKQYASTLRELGLTSDFSKRALDSLRVQVLAAKGCGAMGADVIFVLHENANLDSWEKENSLVKVANISI